MCSPSRLTRPWALAWQVGAALARIHAVTGDHHHLEFFGELGEPLHDGAVAGLGVGVVLLVFGDAEVGTVEELLEADDLRALSRRAPATALPQPTPASRRRFARFKAIKRGYYSIKALNPNGIVPLGPELPFAALL